MTNEHMMPACPPAQPVPADGGACDVQARYRPPVTAWRPALVLAGCALAGVLAGAFAPRLVLLFFALCLAIVLLALARSRRKAVAVAAGVAFLITLLHASYAVRPPAFVPENRAYDVHGRITRVTRYEDGAASVALTQVTADGAPLDGDMYVYLYRPDTDMLEGQYARFAGKVRVPDVRRNPNGPDDRFTSRVYGEMYRASANSVTVEGAPGFFAVAREVMRSRGEALFGGGAPLMLSMLAGNRGDVEAADMEAYRASGLAHLLVVSGLHITFFYGMVVGLLSVLRCPKALKLLLSAAVLTFYCLLVGFSPSTVRAETAAVVYIAAQLCGRRVDGLSAVAIAFALLLCIQPLSLFQPGFQLSFASVLGIYALSGRVGRALRRLPKAVASAAGVTVSAQVGVLPIAVYWFGNIAVYSVFANVLAAPAAALMLPLGCAAQVLYMVWPAAARMAGLICEGCTLYVTGIARIAASLPGSTMPFSSAALAALPVYALFLFVCSRACRMETRRTALAASALVCALLLALPWTRGYTGTRITYLDVGQGNSALVEKGGSAVVVDAGARGVADILESGGIRPGLLMITHADADHARGAPYISAAAAVVPPHYEEPLENAYILGKGDAAAVGGIRADILWPGSGYENENTNESGLVILVETEDGRALFPGDADTRIEALLDAPTADVLCAGHHGSAYSSSEAFLQAVSPAAVVVSVGANNSYGHPADEALERLSASGAALYRTDEEGAVIVEMHGGTVTVRTYAQSWENKLRSFLTGQGVGDGAGGS